MFLQHLHLKVSSSQIFIFRKIKVRLSPDVAPGRAEDVSPSSLASLLLLGSASVAEGFLCRRGFRSSVAGRDFDVDVFSRRGFSVSLRYFEREASSLGVSCNASGCRCDAS